MGETLVVFVEGGLVRDVHGADKYWLVDYDSLESGHCPLCDVALDEWNVCCPECGLYWDVAEEEDIIARIKEMEMNKQEEEQDEVEVKKTQTDRNRQCLNMMDQAITIARHCRPGDRSELDRIYSIIITDLEKASAFFEVYAK